MHKEKSTSAVFTGLLAAVVIVAALPPCAWAQAIGGAPDLGGAASHIMASEVGPLAPLISALYWVAGGVLMGAGALKLKEHAENPTQTPMRQGISRLAVGAALMTIPFFSQFVANTLGMGTSAAGYTPFIAP